MYMKGRPGPAGREANGLVLETLADRFMRGEPGCGTGPEAGDGPWDMEGAPRWWFRDAPEDSDLTMLGVSA